MPYLPIAERELRVAARRRTTFQARMWAAAAACCILLFQIFSEDSSYLTAEMQGEQIFHALVILAFVYALLMGGITSSDCLSVEKREGTLGLLFLTDLKGYDIVIGKLAASSMNAIYSLVAVVPILAIPILMGGVGLTEFGRAILLVASTLALSLATGMLASMWYRNERKSLFYTFTGLFFIYFGPVLSAVSLKLLTDCDVQDLLAASPVGQIVLFLNSNGGSGASYWPSLIITCALAVMFWAWVAVRLPRNWQEKALAKGRAAQRPASNQAESAFRSRLLDQNPFLWIAARDRLKRRKVWFFVVSIFLIWLGGALCYADAMFSAVVVLPLAVLLNTFLKIWICLESSQSLVDARRMGALELFFSTPLTDMDIIDGQWAALRRQFLVPVLCVFGVEALLLFHDPNCPFWLFFVYLVSLPVDLFALGWTGMWGGVTSKSVTRAVMKTVFLNMMLPWMIFGVMMFLFSLLGDAGVRETEHLAAVCGAAIMMGTAFLVGTKWARRNLLARFRAIATEQYQLKKEEE